MKLIVILSMMLIGLSGCQNPKFGTHILHFIDDKIDLDVDVDLDWVSTDGDGNEVRYHIIDIDNVEEYILGPDEESGDKNER